MRMFAAEVNTDDDIAARSMHIGEVEVSKEEYKCMSTAHGYLFTLGR